MGEDRNWKYCVVGNIVKTYVDKNGAVRYGTAAFTGGTKVYLCGKNWDNSSETIMAIGLTRAKQYQAVDTDPERIENVRCQRIRKPSVLKLMDHWEFWHCWWGNTVEDRRETEAFAAKWNQEWFSA